jgi:hypothetical protein
VVKRGKTTPVTVTLEEYVEPVRDETLAKWGRSFFMIGFIGGGLGFGGPYLYQEYIRKQPLYDSAGPAADTIDSMNFYMGPDGAGNQENSQTKLLTDIQLYSAIGGGVFLATSLTFYMIKWFRPENKVDLVASSSDSENNTPTVSITGLGLVPTTDGASFGLSGSF